MVRTVRGTVPRVRQVSGNEKMARTAGLQGLHSAGRFAAGEELVIDWSIEAVLFGNCNCDYF